MASVVGKIRRRQRRRVFAPGRQLLDRSNPIENLSDEETFRKYRFRKNTIFFICEVMNDFLQRPTHRSGALPVLLQVLATLRFLATGSFLSVVGDTISLSTASVSRCVSSFCKGAVQLSRQFIRMPLPEEAATHKMRFYKIAGFPNVIGCVDGTQIRIERPNENENDFINRKGYPSINVQMICDSNYKFTNCVAKWPGSVHDSRIFRESEIAGEFENGKHNGLLLGDSGYACKRYLMTPYNDPCNKPQEEYNKAHCKTRVLVEQSFGILKRRFACLHNELRMNPTKVCFITVTCVMLHNIGIDKQDIVDIEHMECEPDNSCSVEIGHLDGKVMREHITSNYFC